MSVVFGVDSYNKLNGNNADQGEIMSQESVESISGRLLTDRKFFDSCCHSLEKGYLKEGFVVDELELSALRKINLRKLALLTPAIDGRTKRG